MKLRIKLIVPLVLCGAALFGFVRYGIIPHVIDHERAEHIEHLYRQLSTLSTSLVADVKSHATDEIQATLTNTYRNNPNWGYLQMQAADGTILFRISERNFDANMPNILNYQYPVLDQGKTLAQFSLNYDLDMDLAVFRENFRQFQWYALIGGILSLGAVALVLEGCVLRPLGRLRRAATQLAQGHYDTVLPAMKNDEVGQLITSFATMRAAIQRQQQSMATDIMERRRSEQQLQQSLQQQEVIGDILRLSLEPMTLELFLGSVLDILFSVPWLRIQSCGTVFVSSANGMLSMRAQRGLSPVLQQRCAHIAVGHCLCGQAALTGQAVTSSCLDHRHVEQFDHMEEHGHICMPIRSGDTVLGVLNLYVPHGHNHCMEELHFLNNVTSTLASVLERAKAQEALATVNAERDTVFEAIPGMLFKLDLQGYIQHLNSQGSLLSGYSEAEILGHHFIEFIDADDHAHAQRSFEEVLILGTYRARLRLKRKDGRSIQCEWDSALVRDAQGKAIAVAGVGRDITAELAAENAVKRFGRILNQSFNEIYLFDAKTLHFSLASAGALQNLGYSLAELQQFTPLDIKPGYSPDEFVSLLAPLYTGMQQQVLFTTRHRRKDGSEYPVEICLQLYRSENQPSFVAVVQDISERIQSESALRQLNEQLEQRVRERTAEVQNQKFALDQHSIVAITDNTGRITYVNDKFCEISQYSREELLGQYHRLLNSGTHPRAFFIEMWRTISHGKVWHGEICNRRKDGALYWVDSTIVPFVDAQGKPFQYIAIRTDITARKRQESELRRAHDTALAADRAKSDFLAVMSHEIRTPMNGVLGVLDIMRDWDLAGEQKEYLVAAAQSANGLMKLLNNLLDFSKIEARQIRLEQLEFSPQTTLNEVRDLYCGKAQAKGIEINVAIDTALPESVIGDPTRWRQIILNLLDNALKFTAYGSIQLRLRQIEASTTLSRLRLEVQDSGIGIPLDAQQNIFLAFTQADSSTTRKYGGTGLGLSIVSKLVELQYGKLGVDSQPDQGATFWVELPFEQVQEDRRRMGNS